MTPGDGYCDRCGRPIFTCPPGAPDGFEGDWACAAEGEGPWEEIVEGETVIYKELCQPCLNEMA